ncbi:MAG: ATP-binding cassette domain-containing protein [Pseudomonadota bacterium]
MLTTIRRLIGRLTPQRRRTFYLLLGLYVAVGSLQAAGIAALGPFVAVALDPSGATSGSGMIADLYRRFQFTSPAQFTAALGLVAAGLIVAGQGSFILVERMRLKWMHTAHAALSRDAFANFMGRPYAFFATRHSGEIHAVVLAETQQVAFRFLFPMIEAFSRLVIVAALVIMMLLVDAAVALLAAGLLGSLFFGTFLLTSRRLKRAGERIKVLNRLRFNRSQELFAGVKELKLRGLEDQATHQYRDAAFNLANNVAHAELLRILPRPLIEGLVFASVIAATSILAIVNDAALAAFVPKAAVFVVAGYRMLPAAQTTLTTVQGMRIGEPIATSLLAELDTPVAKEPKAASAPQSLRKAVDGFATLRLRDVGFTYPDAGAPALKGINLDVARNGSLGIMGASGAGKSTLLDVMLGLLPPTEGTMMVDDTPLEGSALALWRARVGYVSQTIYLADDTIAANIAFGDTHPDRTRIETAARLAALDGYTKSLPDGLATRIGEGGARMSGGQRQRLAIARALYSDPDIVFLDEATSALDSATEAQIMDELTRLVGTRTLVIVAHRLSTLSICQTIVELSDGSVKRLVSHDELTAGHAAS